MTTVADLIARARIGRDITEGGLTRHHPSTVHALPDGETITCFFATKAPNSRGSNRGRHNRIGFTYRGREISRAKAEELLKGS